MFRVGLGFDLHPLVAGRPLVLGGLTIKHHSGLKGHSDADVLLHALMDALLGAAGLKDIGHYFPPGDEKFRDMDSTLLLKDVMRLIDNANYRVGNADLIIMAEEPKISPYIDEMVEKIARILKIPDSRVSVKATTTEKLGVCGRKEAIAAQAVVLLEENGRH